MASSTTPRSWLISIAVKPCLALQVLDRLHDGLLHDHVERGGRLVEDDQPRVEGERQRDRDPLPHAAGQLVREPAEHVGVELHLASSSAPRSPHGRPLRSSPGRACALRMSPKWRSTVRTGLSAFMPLCSTSAKPLRRWRGAAPRRASAAMSAPSNEIDAAFEPGRRPQHPGERVAERGLAAAGLADQADELALLKDEVDVADRPDPLSARRLVDDVDAARLQQCHHFSLSRGLDSASTPKLISVNDDRQQRDREAGREAPAATGR